MSTFHNNTRTSASIPQKLSRQGKWHLVVLYHILSLSDLAREGFNFSGSYRFADHIYASIPKGKYGIGIIIDSVLLSLPSARSFRNRYILTRDEIVRQIREYKNEKEIHILSVPAGIPRTLLDAAEIVCRTDPDIHKKIVFHCLDLDRKLVHKQKKIFSKTYSQHTFMFHVGDALQKKDYPVRPHIIVSTGLGEFLDTEKLTIFYNVCHRVLQKNGVFITSATKIHKLSDYLMRNIGELYTSYRTREEIKMVFNTTSFSSVRTYKDPIGFQTIVIAKK